MPGDLSTVDTLGVPKVPLGSDLRFTNADGGGDPAHDHHVQVPVPRCRQGRRSRCATARRAWAGRSSSTRRSWALGVPEISGVKNELEWTHPGDAGRGLPARRGRHVLLPHPSVDARRVQGRRRTAQSQGGGRDDQVEEVVAGPVGGAARSTSCRARTTSTCRRRRRRSRSRSCGCRTARSSAGGGKFNMSRRQFVRTSAAMAIGFWAIDAVMTGPVGQLRLGAQHGDDRRLRPRVGRAATGSRR